MWSTTDVVSVFDSSIVVLVIFYLSRRAKSNTPCCKRCPDKGSTTMSIIQTPYTTNYYHNISDYYEHRKDEITENSTTTVVY